MAELGFSAALARFGPQAVERIDRVRRASVLELFQLVVLATPVDTGRLRGNWQATVNSPALEPVDREDRSGQSVVAEVLANMGGLPDAVYLTNNLPYAEAIEYGHSRQAPEGMMRRNVVRWQEIVEKKAAHYLNGGT